MTLYFIKSDKKNYWLLAGVTIGLTFASRYPIAIQAITIFIVESFIRKDIRLILRTLAGAVPTIILVIFAVYLKTGTFSGAIPEDTRFSFPPSLFYVANWSEMWGYAFLFIPIAFLFKRTWKDKYNYTFIMWFLVALVFWSANASNYQERFIIQFAPAAYFLVVLAIENITKVNISHKLKTTILVASLFVIAFGIMHVGISNFIDFNNSIQSSQGSFYFDKKFVPIMNNISNIVPRNDTLVMSFNSTSLLDYFIQSELEIPYGVYSLQSLEEYMKEKDRRWLLVYENVSHTKSLNPLFSKEGLKDLNTHFRKISEYSTEDQSRFHLYKLK